MLGLTWQHVGLSTGSNSSLSPSLPPWGNKTCGKLKRASLLQRPQGRPVGQEHREGHVPCSPGSELSPGHGTSMLARNDLCSWLWNGALFIYPLSGASKTRTCKSDNNQEKASCSWFVKRRPWAIVLSAIHRSLKSMELCLQLHHRESELFYLDCEKLLNRNNNTEENCLISGFVKIPNLDQVHWQVLNHQWCLRQLKRFGWAAGRSQAKMSIFSWGFLNVPAFIRTANRQEEFELPEIIWRVKWTFMGTQWMCPWWNQKQSDKCRMASMRRSSEKEWVAAGPLTTWRKFPVCLT